MVLKSRPCVLGEKMSVDRGRLRVPPSLNGALNWWASENGFTGNRAVVVLLERALRCELERVGDALAGVDG